MEVSQKSQSQYSKYKFSSRLSHWKKRQDYLVKNITNCKKQIENYKQKIGKYEERLFEYESYMMVLNPLDEEISKVRGEAAARLQEAIQEVGEEDSEDESVMSDDNTDAQSVATCSTLIEMREQVARRLGRR